MMDARCKQMATPTRHDKVVRREICSIVTKGTRTPSFSEGVESESDSAFLLAIKEKAGDTANESIYGVCFIDTSIGQFHLGQFDDDRQSSRLRTLLAHYPPAHLLYERHNLSPRTMQILKRMLGCCLQDALSPNVEFWGSSRTLKTLAEGEYFSSDQEFEWPHVLKEMLAEGDSLGLTAKEDSDLAVSSLGACVHCLTRCLIERNILSMKSFTRYEPVDVSGGRKEKEGGPHFTTSQRMVLDDITLSNLDVVDHPGQQDSSLLQRLDHCSTPFGRRLLKQWLCAPLCSPRAIHDRLDSVQTLMGHAHLVGEAHEKMKSLPDLERLLRQIHGVGMRRPNSTHPDSRAIMFEEATYSKRKIIGFLSVLEGFKTSAELSSLFAAVAGKSKSSLLKRVVCREREGGKFPDLTEQLQFFSAAFDHTKARKEGTIIPARGVNPAYDAAVETIHKTATCLEEYLAKQKKVLACPSLVYWGTGRNRFQLEVPESTPASRIPRDYELKSQKKGCRRYWTKETKRCLEVTMAAEEDKQMALKDTMRTIFHSFAQHFSLWESAVQCLATLDVLMSLTTYSSLGDGEMCRPEIVSSPVPFLDVMNSRHPCISLTCGGDDFIPNDVIINGGRSPEGSLVVVVTGPNMGGKSTLMRQTGLLVILAQLGCYVPASSCALSPVDRVFTRIGASDKITSGESTFFVELSETATILHHATSHSLVLVDELGRGTATYDGTAIASAVLRELSVGVACRTLFSTHYHNLVDDLHGNLKISLGHMACMVEKEEEEEGEGEDGVQEDSVTFLYKFMEGACPKSYGFNAAKLAGLPPDVIRAARRKAREFEKSTERRRLFRKLVGLAPDFPLDQLLAIQTRLKQLHI
ncbi:DNA mismatch repair protein Msh6 [Geodia barretti]|nr:DNA mismatch repair protein Msh6 [Geodia barretti]